MAARLGPNRLIDQARSAARRYVNALPLADRVMVVRAGVLATPALLFESDRKKIQIAIDQTQPGAASLDLEGALDFARRAQRIQAQRPGEIVFIGAARIPSRRIRAPRSAREFSFRPDCRSHEHVGLRKMTVHRATDDPDIWEVFLAVKNYGTAPHSVPATVSFGGSPVATHRFDLAPGAEESFSFRFRTRARGWLEARLPSPETFRQDSHAILELPPRGVVPVTVYSADPDLLRPIFTAIPGIQANFLPLAKYDPKYDPRQSKDARRHRFVRSFRSAVRCPPPIASGSSRPPTNRPSRSRTSSPQPSSASGKPIIRWLRACACAISNLPTPRFSAPRRVTSPSRDPAPVR